ncbi:hypothetical protein RhiirA1_475448 [Rhizophagus irregularis]|uniref:FAR1 domain-containing protein n=1 Tax=Rhizophagus irregularis TaxID=588596 RepID=A0A2N0QWT5_9GLOM|nr:hypothetical protein RhiirA1_475448 [Rhizophagus irregularis]
MTQLLPFDLTSLTKIESFAKHKRGFGYQVYQNDKDPNDFTIIQCKSFRCSSNGKYESRKTNCEWHYNFSFPKTANQVKCISLKDIHNHEVNPTQLPYIIARYRRFDNEMIKDLKFFLDCKKCIIISWAKAYMPFQFNGGIQSTQSIKSFNGIIKRSLNRTSTLCEMEEAINKRHEEEIRYCQLTDLKAKYTTVGLSHLLNFFQMLIQLLLNF